jgi:hypothetical protein
MSNNQIVDQAIELEHKGEEKLDQLAAQDGQSFSSSLLQMVSPLM